MKTHQFTVRNVPDSVSRLLRKKAKERGVSMNRVLVEALERTAGLSGQPERHHDLDALSGTWCKDPAADAALADQRRVDERDWR